MKKTPRRALTTIRSGAILLGLACLMLWLKQDDSPQLLGQVVRRVETGEKAMALSFDDGPDPRFTLQILELLSRYGARATFFLVGRNVEAHPGIVREIHGRGHEVGNHTWDHASLVFRIPAFIQAQIEATDNAIRNTGYGGHIPFRAPYGHKLFVLPFILWKTDRPHVLWSVSPRDWREARPEEMLRAVEEQASNGDIVLLHDGNVHGANTVKLVELILERYMEVGFRFVTISELLSLARPPGS